MKFSLIESKSVFEYNKLTLYFSGNDAHLNENYTDSNYQAFLKNGRISLLVSIAIFLVFGITDYFIVNDIFLEAISLRVMIAAILGIGAFAATYTNYFKLIGDKLIGVAVLAAGVSLLYIISQSSAMYKIHYFFGFYLVVLVANVLFKQSYRFCVLSSLIYTLIFEFTIVRVVNSPSLIILHHFYYYAVLTMQLFNSYSSEYHRMKEFYLAKTLEIKNGYLKDKNDNLDQEVKEKTKELENSLSRLQNVNNIQQSFLKNISHLIRTPLNSIIGISGLMLEEYQGMHIDDLKQINKSGKELLHVIEDIVLFSKIETDTLKINSTKINVNNIFKTLNSYFDSINKKGLSLRINKFDSKLCYIESDFDKIIYIMEEVLRIFQLFTFDSNIDIGFLPLDSDSVKLYVSTKEYSAEFSKMSKCLDRNMFEYDNLIYSPEFKIRLMYLLSKELGRGLTVQSDIDKGSMLSLDITTHIEVLDMPKNITERGRDIHDLDNISILVAEDIDFNYRILQRVLTKYGARVTRANNGVQAVKLASEYIYDIVLMDIEMPKKTGTEATKELRNKGISVPIIAQTANIMAEDKHICLERGWILLIKGI
jgi:CheY-like chemotaxis protein